MKKGIIIAASIIVVGVTSLLIYTSLAKVEVAFTLKGSGYTVQIRNTKGSLITELESSSNIPLRKGDYFYNIEGEGFDAKSIPFAVSKSSKSVTVSPQYLDGYLSKLQETEKATIIAILKKKYPSITTISIVSLKIESSNQWAYGTLTVDGSGDLYRFVMKRNDKTWEVAVKPSITLSIKDNPTIPEEILYSLY